MQYLIVSSTGQFEPFVTPYFDADNLYAEGMVVYDLHNLRYSSDGATWNPIQEDHL